MVVVCRLCLNLTEVSYPVSCLKTPLKAVLPDIDLTLTKDPVVCKGCADSVTSSFKFKYKCMEQEKKVQKLYNETKNPVNLYALVEKSCYTAANDTKNSLVVKGIVDVKVKSPCENPDKIKQGYYKNHVKNGMEEIKESVVDNGDMSNVIEIVESDVVSINVDGKFDSQSDRKITRRSKRTPSVKPANSGSLKVKQKKNIPKFTSGFPFSCKFCKKKFRQQIHLYGHLLKKHEDLPGIAKMVRSKIYCCQYCSYQTINNYTFAQHLHNKHKDI